MRSGRLPVYNVSPLWHHSMNVVNTAMTALYDSAIGPGLFNRTAVKTHDRLNAAEQGCSGGAINNGAATNTSRSRSFLAASAITTLAVLPSAARISIAAPANTAATRSAINPMTALVRSACSLLRVSSFSFSFFSSSRAASAARLALRSACSLSLQSYELICAAHAQHQAPSLSRPQWLILPSAAYH